jgi:uncharacterized protein (TIGR02300 family)
VANEDLGTKRDCPNCGARFYDLQKDPAHCPKCDHEFTPDVLLKSRKKRDETPEAVKPSAKVDESATETDDDEVEELVAENETSLDDADVEAKPTKSKRVKSLDEDEDDDEDEEDLDNIDDIDLPDDEDDDTLLDDDDDADDLGVIAPTGKDDDER